MIHSSGAMTIDALLHVIWKTHMCHQERKRTVGRCDMPLEICCSQNDATMLVRPVLLGLSCRASSHLIVTCHGEAQEIMMEKTRFILYPLPTD